MFPRKYLAESLQKIAAAGAKLIVIDGVPQRDGDDPGIDNQLAEAFKRTPTVIAKSTEVVVDSDPNGNQRRTKVYNKPIALFEQSVKAVIPMEVRLTGGVVREICLSNERDVFSADRLPLLSPLRTFVRPDIPEPGGFDFINFYGPPSTLTSLSIGELIGPLTTVSEQYFKDRVVFIGAHSDSGAGVESGKDSFLTSVSSEWMFGVEIHATIAANLLDRSWIRRISNQLEGVGQAVIALCLSYIILGSSMFAGVLIALTFVPAWLLLSYYCFVHSTLFIPAIILCAEVILVLVIRWGLAAFASRRRD